MILLTVILLELLTGMEFDLFVPSFPELQNHFALSPFWVEALLSVNFIGFCLSLFFVGAMADRYGRRSIILVGISLFVIGSLFCVLAGPFPLLLLGRFLQGVGIAAPAILSFLIVADSYSLERQQYFMAMLNAVINASVAVAPVIGSYITLYFHWQGNFYTLLLLGVVALFMSLLFIPQSKLQEKASPGGYLILFQSKPLMLLIVTLVAIFVPYWIFVGIAPLLYMRDLGVSLSQFGYYQGALALVFSLGSFFYGLIMNRTNPKKMLALSYALFVMSLLCITTASAFDCKNPLLITLTLIPFVIAQIVPSSALYPICLNFLPEAKGRVSAVLQGGRLIFASLGLQLAGFCYTGTFATVGIVLSSFIAIIIFTLFFVLKENYKKSYS